MRNAEACIFNDRSFVLTPERKRVRDTDLCGKHCMEATCLALTEEQSSSLPSLDVYEDHVIHNMVCFPIAYFLCRSMRILGKMLHICLLRGAVSMARGTSPGPGEIDMTL